MDRSEVPAGRERAYCDHLEEEGAVKAERWDVRGKVVHTAKSRPPNISPICSKKDK